MPDTSTRVAALTSLPSACLTPAASPQETTEIRLGALAFNSPALLGGQAEKKGISCGTCHQNGRGNPDFQFDSISGAPGTADVTSGLFSKARADNTFNPVPIPDLATPGGQDQIDRTHRAALAVFVRGQIEEEFGGDPPPDEIFNALLTYLSHIDGTPENCDLLTRTARTWRQDWADARLASDRLQNADTTQLQAFYKRTARLALGRIHARYHAYEHGQLRAELVQLSYNLSADTPLPPDTSKLRSMLEEEAPRSLYAADVLEAYLAAGAP